MLLPLHHLQVTQFYCMDVCVGCVGNKNICNSRFQKVLHSCDDPIITGNADPQDLADLALQLCLNPNGHSTTSKRVPKGMSLSFLLSRMRSTNASCHCDFRAMTGLQQVAAKSGPPILL